MKREPGVDSKIMEPFGKEVAEIAKRYDREVEQRVNERQEECTLLLIRAGCIHLLQRSIWDERDVELRHARKRVMSHVVFDKLLDKCQKGICPDFPRDETVMWLLVDISLDGYIFEKAYYYYTVGKGSDDQWRYFEAKRRIGTVFECNVLPSFDAFLLNDDSNEVNRKHFEAARRRKAYWTYLRHWPDNSYYTDYCGACAFIDRLHDLSSASPSGVDDLDNARHLLQSNFHIANALDLYRFCLIKKKAWGGPKPQW